MSRPPIKKGAGQTPDEMALQMIETQAGNHMYENNSQRRGTYGEISNQLKQEALTTAIDQQMQLLKKAKERGRVNLDDLDEVEATANSYMEACKLANAFPTMLGFSAALGYSRMHLYRYISNNNNRVTQYLDSLRSSWAAIIAQMGLSRQASESVSIFLLKNSAQGLADKTEMDITASQRKDDYEVTDEERERWAQMLKEMDESDDWDSMDDGEDEA